MAGIFISYRQDDAKAWAIVLRDELGRVFGDAHVFLDKDTLHAGNWRAQIEKALDTCRVVLVVIGPRWLTIADARNRPRIQLADDIHHQEVAMALSRRDLVVIPVLVDEAPMPGRDRLPADLQALCDQQARKIGDTQGRRQADLAVLIRDIQSIGGVQRRHDPSPPPVTLPRAPGRIGWFRREAMALASAFVLTVAAGIYAYTAGSPMAEPSLLFVLLVFYAAARAVPWLWSRVLTARGERR